jgi:hypothetical protein
MSVHIAKKIKDTELDENTTFVEALFLLQEILSSDTDSNDNTKAIVAMNDFSEKMKSLKCCLDYSQESIFILLYSSILLYNDLFNIKIQKKITLKQFIKMLKGCNSKNDFPEDLLISIYDNVQINNKANVDNIDNIDNIARDKNKKNSWCIIL